MTSRILVFIPAYNCEKQIRRVLSQLEADWCKNHVSEVIVVNNRSTDSTATAVEDVIRQRDDHFIKILLNRQNYGLGGSHKVAFQYAIANGFDWLVVLHGDDQGSIQDLQPTLEEIENVSEDAVLGSRFMARSSTPGYSRFRVFGNHVFNLLYSFCLLRRIHDLGAGLNLYRVNALRRNDFKRFPDNLTFNCVMLSAQIIDDQKIRFVPISWREDDQVSNVKLVRQSLQTLRIALNALFFRKRFISKEHREKEISAYEWDIIDV